MAGDRWKEMCHRVQIRDENVREYFHEKVHLCRLVEMSFYESKIKILEGLFSKDLSIYLLGRNHNGEYELLISLNEYERLDESRSLRIRQASGVKDGSSQKFTTSR